MAECSSRSSDRCRRGQPGADVITADPIPVSRAFQGAVSRSSAASQRIACSRVVPHICAEG